MEKKPPQMKRESAPTLHCIRPVPAAVTQENSSAFFPKQHLYCLGENLLRVPFHSTIFTINLIFAKRFLYCNPYCSGPSTSSWFLHERASHRKFQYIAMKHDMFGAWNQAPYPLHLTWLHHLLLTAVAIFLVTLPVIPQCFGGKYIGVRLGLCKCGNKWLTMDDANWHHKFAHTLAILFV